MRGAQVQKEVFDALKAGLFRCKCKLMMRGVRYNNVAEFRDTFTKSLPTFRKLAPENEHSFVCYPYVLMLWSRCQDMPTACQKLERPAFFWSILSESGKKGGARVPKFSNVLWRLHSQLLWVNCSIVDFFFR